MVPFTNVTVTIALVAQNTLSDGTLDNIATGTTYTGLAAFLQELDAGEVWQEFNVQLLSPAAILIPIVSLSSGVQWHEAQVTVTASSGSGSYTGRVYRIHGNGSWHDDGLSADHVSFLVDRMTVPLT